MSAASDRPSRWLGAGIGAIAGLGFGWVAYVIAMDMPRSASSTVWLLPGALGLGALGGAAAGAFAITELVSALRAPSRQSSDHDSSPSD